MVRGGGWGLAALPRPRGGMLIPGVLIVLVSLVRAMWLPGMTDLDVYRLGGASVLAGQDHLYALADPATKLPFTYPPFSALAAAPLAMLPDLGAVFVIGVLILACLTRIAVLVVLAAPAARTGVAVWLVMAGVWALSEPGRATIGYGQVSTVLAWLVVEDLLGVGRNSRMQGLLTGIAVGIKLVPGVFVLMYLVLGRWRAAGVASLTAAGTVAVGWVVAPVSSVQFWTGIGFDPARVGGVDYAGNQSLNGLAWRLAGPGGTPLLWAVGVVGVLGWAGVVVRRCGRSGDLLGALAAAALAGLLCSPISWTHHWIWLGPVGWWVWRQSAALGASRVSARTGRALSAAVVIAAAVGPILLVPSGSSQERSWTAIQLLLGNSYLLVGIATLTWMLHATGGRPAAADLRSWADAGSASARADSRQVVPGEFSVGSSW